MVIEQEIREFVIDNFLFGQSDESFSDSDSFLEKGLIDSMGILSLVEFVRGKYLIAIQDEELVPENWDSVQRIARFVQRKLRSVTSDLNPSHALASGE
jgi:acyl carrier protein